MAGRAQQPNFKLDVNRTKTKRWADAKAASYEGDDWGGYDEYGDFAEEDEEEEPPLPPAPATAPEPTPKVTGLRQRGTTSVRDAQTASSKTASSSTTSPPASQQGPPRRLSFEDGEEHRNFSNVSAEEPAPPAMPMEPVELPAHELPAGPVSSRPASHEPAVRPEQRRSPQPRPSSDRQAGPPGPPRQPDGRGLPPGQMAPGQMPPGGRLPDRTPPGNGRFYAQTRTASGPAPGGVPPSGIPPDGYQRREFSAPGPNQPPPQMRQRPSQEFGQRPAKKSSQEFRGPPPPRGQPDFRGPPPPGAYRGPPPGRDPRDYRGPPPADYRGPPYHDPRGRGGPPFDPRGPPPRDYRGPPQDYRGPPPGRGGPPPDFRQRPPPPGGRGPLPGGPPPEFRPRNESLSAQDRPGSSSAARVPQPPVGLPEVSVSAPGAHPEPSAPSPPIVRPADIYKRLPEERERASLDSGRPSLDTADRAGQPRSSTDSHREADKQPKLAPRLDTVAERKSEYGIEDKAAGPLNPPLIPQFDRFSGFGLDLGWDSGPSLSDSMSLPQEPAVTQAEKGSALKQEETFGLRDAVNDAFEHEDKVADSAKSPPQSDMSRSNTDSTAGISPIMSRVPSASTAQRRADGALESGEAPPPIPEEYLDGSRPASASTMKAMQAVGSDKRDASVGSAGSGGVRQFSSPEAVEGPAHTAAISARKRVDVSDVSKKGELAIATPIDTEFASASNMSHRESDLAASASSKPTSPEIGQQEKQAQNSFMESARQRAPPLTTKQPPSNNSRTASPSKGRVQQLANKYDFEPDRGSDASSVSSWSSSAKPSPRQSIDENVRERPSMPGQWASFNESGTSLPDADASLKPAGLNSKTPTPRARSPGDLAPTTAPQKLPGQTFESHAEGAMAQLAASGNALAQNLQAAMAKKGSPEPGASAADSQTRDRSETASTARPLVPPPGMQGIGSSASSVPPTPPTKDSPHDRDGAPQRQSGYFPNAQNPPPLRVSNPDPAAGVKPDQPSAGSGFSVSSSPGDSENDRLREDIFKSLSAPLDSPEAALPVRPGLHPMHTDMSRDSSTSLIPHEYDSYWAGSGGASRNDSQRPSIASKPSDPLMVGAAAGATATAAAVTAAATATKSGAPAEKKTVSASLDTKPKLSNRFSWEEGEEAALAPDAQEEGDEALPRVSQERVPEPASDDSDDDANSDAPFESDDEQEPSRRESKVSAVDTSSPVELDGSDSRQAPLQQVSPRAERPPSYGTDPGSPTAPRTSSLAAKGPSAPGSPSVTQRAFSSSLPPLTGSGGAPLSDIPSFRGASDSGKTSTARTGAYKSAFQETATMATGLETWLTHMASAHPEHLSAGFGGARPSTAGTGTVRNKMPHDLGQTGQDFMHAAGKLGGKATLGAKGLFAKGKSRFRRGSVDKAPE